MLSDIILGSFSFIFYLLIVKKNKYWGYFFLFMSISAFLGGFWHGYFEGTNNFLRIFSWIFLSISLLMPGMDLYKNIKIRSFLIGISFVLILPALFSHNFIFMIIDALIIMIGFVMIKSMILSKKHKGYIYVYLGIICSLISVFFQITKYSFAKYLNYNDIGHYISAISLFIIFLGINSVCKEIHQI